jgi:Zn-dependent M28 family amino/carboxypeptidase
LPAPTSTERAVAEQLQQHVTALSVDIGPRRATLGNSLQRAEQYIVAELVKVQPAPPTPRREALPGAPGSPANIVLELPGSEPGPLVLLGAHYDTDQGGTPGANDNGSGVAAALVLAARLAPAKHRLPIRIVFFANEEMPYFTTPAMGSLHHAQGCRKRGEVLRAMLSLETMGYYSDEPGSQKYPAPLSFLYPDRGNFIGFVGDLASRSLVREVIGHFRAGATIPSEGAALPAALPGVGWSDHWAFWQQGYAAIMVTDTALFRDPTYHRHSDISPNLDYQRLARVVVGLERVVLELASN